MIELLCWAFIIHIRERELELIDGSDLKPFFYFFDN